MKINELYSEVESKNLFYILSQRGIFGDSEEEARELDFDYFNSYSYSKDLNLFASNLFAKFNDIEAFNEKISDIILVRYSEKWNKLLTAFNEKYNPIENYSMKETENTPKDVTISRNANSKVESSSTSSTGVYGFNSTDSIPSATSDSETTTQGNKIDNTSEENTHEETNRTLSRSGNIGVTTSQQMLESEIALREKYNLNKIIYHDIDLLLTSLIY